MEVGKFYETKCFTLSIINESHLVYFTDQSITKCSHYAFEGDLLVEITRDEYLERLDKVLVTLNIVDEVHF